VYISPPIISILYNPNHMYNRAVIQLFGSVFYLTFLLSLCLKALDFYCNAPLQIPIPPTPLL